MGRGLPFSPKSCLGSPWGCPQSPAVICLLQSPLFLVVVLAQEDSTPSSVHRPGPPVCTLLAVRPCCFLVGVMYPAWGRLHARGWGQDCRQDTAPRIPPWSDGAGRDSGYGGSEERLDQQAAPSPGGSSTRRRERGTFSVPGTQPGVRVRCPLVWQLWECRALAGGAAPGGVQGL